MPAAAPADLLSLAERLAKPGADDAAIRAGVGRAYYACVIAIRTVIEHVKSVPPYDVHSAMAHYLKAASVRDRRFAPLWSRFLQLRQYRERADYEYDAPFSAGDAAAALRLAKAFLTDLAGLESTLTTLLRVLPRHPSR